MAKDDKSSKVDTKKLLIPKAGFATVKANQRLAGAPTAAPVIPHGQSKKQLPIVKPEIIKDNPYFDHTIGVPVKAKKKQNLKFVRHGKFVQKAEQLRAHAKMEELKKKIAETVKKAGMDNLDLVSDKAVQREPPPLIEWWDSALLYHNKSYDELPTDDTFLLFSEAVPVSEDSKESLPPVTHYVLHPIPIQPPFHTGPPPPRPLMLTAKERKKIRRQRRAEELKEKQDKQRLGLIPPDPPKVKMSNLMRVLANEAIQDPTKIEAMVREQVEKRQHEHHAANQARKLTEEQKKEKKKKKLEEDTSAMVDVAIYKVKDLSHPKIKFKVDTNAQQLNLTGVAVVNPTCNIVIVEGGPKGLKKYKKLMLRRIDWSETSGLEPKEEKDESNDGKSYIYYSIHNGAYLIWEGQVRKRAFHGFRFKACPLEKMVLELLSRARVEHYWELAKNWKASGMYIFLLSRRDRAG
ncbi:pre-mRNA processing factor 3-domain-containing protein [Paraphysoderma sedebokerense]|nr:pre-mRNA processing factor 3-domain-containing protein [Paraphysoderma sedebokerense]